MSNIRDQGGFSMIETSVAFTVLAFGLSGLLSVVVASSRQMEYLESRNPASTVLHVRADASRWAARLGVPAFVSVLPLPAPPDPQEPVRTLHIVSYSANAGTGQISLEVAESEPTP